MRRVCTSLAVAALLVLLALPAAAQQDPYVEVLPGEFTRPGDVTAPPDGVAPAPGAAGPVQGQVPNAPAGVVSPAPRGDVGPPPAGAVSPVRPGEAAGPARGGGVSAAQGRVVVFGRDLPVTGVGLTVSLVLAFGLIGGGTAALRFAHRRRATG